MKTRPVAKRVDFFKQQHEVEGILAACCKEPTHLNWLSMVTSKIKKLAEAKAAVELLEQSIAKELAALPSDYGFVSVEEFIIAVKAAGRSKRRGPGRRKVQKRRKRAKITEGTRAKVKKLVKAGKTGSQIAKALKISLPSVQNIKKALSLVKTAKKPVRKPKVLRAKAKRFAAPKVRVKRVSPKKSAAPESKPAEASAEPAPPAPSA
jgi:hypothetical protein